MISRTKNKLRSYNNIDVEVAYPHAAKLAGRLRSKLKLDDMACRLIYRYDSSHQAPIGFRIDLWVMEPRTGTGVKYGQVINIRGDKDYTTDECVNLELEILETL
jgi:hypothetical protein